MKKKGGQNNMMQIGNVNSTGNSMQVANAQASSEVDSVSKDIQSKIMNAQKQRQDLLSNREMTAEEKSNKRQKIQQEISDLKRELRQYQAEQKKKQQEEDQAAKTKKEQKERESDEAVKKQQRRNQLAEDVKGQQSENVQESDRSQKSSRTEIDQENKEMQPNGLHKIIISDSSIKQFQAMSNAVAQMDKKIRIQDAEIKQDAARGTDVKNIKKEQRAELQKEAHRMEAVQTFMFKVKYKAPEISAGKGNQFARSVMRKGLYSDHGTMSGSSLQAIQMDVKQ